MATRPPLAPRLRDGGGATCGPPQHAKSRLPVRDSWELRSPAKTNTGTKLTLSPPLSKPESPEGSASSTALASHCSTGVNVPATAVLCIQRMWRCAIAVRRARRAKADRAALGSQTQRRANPAAEELTSAHGPLQKLRIARQDALDFVRMHNERAEAAEKSLRKERTRQQAANRIQQCWLQRRQWMKQSSARVHATVDNILHLTQPPIEYAVPAFLDAIPLIC